jgi:hypothetical protein
VARGGKEVTMTSPAAKISFSARLLEPQKAGASWTFLVLPRAASAKLPTRGITTVEGTLNGCAFRADLQPDGQKSHWLKVSRKLREQAGAAAGDTVQLEIRPSARALEPRVPADLRKALGASSHALAAWKDITPVARRDWISWITSARKAETRVRRVGAACDMLASGKRRVCCFDRSGFYSKEMSAPAAKAP